MKKMNKKGFTLIELLAVIVILAIIMVIAVPQILNVINSSRDSAWQDNLGMIEKSIELNTTIYNPSNGNVNMSLATVCPSSNDTDVTATIKGIADIDSNVTVKCKKQTTTGEEYLFTVSGGSAGQFSGKTGQIACSTSNVCKVK